MKTSSLTPNGQRGAGLLTIVALLGGIMLMVQGTLFYKARSSAKFVNMEKNKILAQQMAEAGVEDNIAEIGLRKLKVTAGMTNYTTFDHKALGGGFYTSKLTTLAIGASADTVDLASTGSVGTSSATVCARLQLKKYLDTSKTAIIVVKPETTITITSRVVPETTTTITVKDPETMPLINTTSAYAAFMSSGEKKTNICHLPSGDVTKANVIDVARAAVDTHISHHGDYLTTDLTCDIYKPKTVLTITTKSVLDTTRSITDKTTYDTSLVIDTVVKTKFLSWK
jgi:hypothetical protein